MFRMSARGAFRIFIAFLLAAGLAPVPRLAGAAGALGAQLPPASDAGAIAAQNPMLAPGSAVRVFLLTMGNGAEVWELFGHTAIWIHDDRTARDTVFNWGVFDRSQPNFIPRFLKGLMLYQMGGTSMAQLMYEYRYFNRSVISQELNLTAPQKDLLLAIIRVNARPENLQYRYDYFIDNCSTRPRDILDRVLGGRLRPGADSVTTHSYRWHALRLMQGDALLALGVDIGLGEPADRPVTRWQEMFLPRELHDWVATRQVPDSTGALRPLVKSERVLFQATRPPEFESPPRFGWLWITGLVVGALFAWLGFAARRGSHGARVGAAVLYAVWATTCGVLGVILTLLWTVTDHRFAHANENLLLFNPLWLALAVMLPMYVLRGRAASATRGLVLAMAALAAIALAAHAVMLSRQDNLAIIGLALPVISALALVMWERPRQVATAQDRL